MFSYDFKPGKDNLNRRLILLLTIFLVLSGFFVFNGFLEWDEGSFLMNAEHFSQGGENFEESRPAALSAMVSFLWIFTGESVAAARFLVLMFGAGTLILFHRLASREFDDPIYPTAVLALSPLMIYWSSRLYTDVPALFFLTASVLAYRKKKYLLSGALVSVAATFRYLFLVFAASITLSVLIEKRERIKDIVTGGLIGASPFLAYSWIGYGSPFSRIRMYVSRVSRWSDSGMLSAAVPNLVSLGQMLSGLIPVAALGWRNSPVLDRSLVFFYSVFMVLFSGNSFGRYWMAVLPVVILMAYRCENRKLFAAGSIIMLLSSGLALAGEYRTHQECSEPLHQALDYTSELEGDVVSDSWAVSGFVLDRKVHSTWTSYERLESEYGVEYAIVEEELDYLVLESFSSECRTYYVYSLDPAT